MSVVERTRVGAYAVVTHGGSILLTEVAVGPGRGTWGLPGGGIEHGESPQEALTRELREETGLRVESPSLLTVFTTRTTWTLSSGETEDVHYVGIVFRAEAPTRDEPHPAGDGGSCSAARWFELAELASASFPLAKHARRILEEAGLLHVLR